MWGEGRNFHYMNGKWKPSNNFMRLLKTRELVSANFVYLKVQCLLGGNPSQLKRALDNGISHGEIYL